MKLEELMDCCKMAFGFHPDEQFSSIGELLHVGRKSCRKIQYYDSACSILAESMAKYIDEQNAE